MARARTLYSFKNINACLEISYTDGPTDGPDGLSEDASEKMNIYLLKKTQKMISSLGLAIGVEMVGQGVVTLVEHDEDYIITFPKGYGRY